MLSYLIKLVTLVVLILHIESSSAESSESTSYDSLIASQCRARCFSLYPWKTLNNTSAIDRKHRSFRFKRVSLLFTSSVSLFFFYSKCLLYRLNIYIIFARVSFNEYSLVYIKDLLKCISLYFIIFIHKRHSHHHLVIIHLEFYHRIHQQIMLNIHLITMSNGTK